MSEETTIVEKTVETAIAAAIAVNLALLKPENQGLAGVVINGLFLENPKSDGTPGKRRDVNGSRINLTCKPNLPHGYRSAARVCHLVIESITPPDDDSEHKLAVLCYAAVRKVFDNGEFSLPAAVMELRGYLITDGDAGIREDGFVVSLSVRLEVFVKSGV